MKHVAILIETSRAYGRGLLRGIARYHQEHGNWSTYFQPQGLGDEPPPWMKTWKGDGVIARIEHPKTAEILLQLDVPVVNLRTGIPDLPFPFIGADNQSIAKMGVDHLMERGFQQLAFCSLKSNSHQLLEQRKSWFEKYAAQAGLPCTQIEISKVSWEAQQKEIIRALSRVQKPLGLMAVNDDLGLQVLEACRRVELSVPEEVAVLGVDNDEYLCDLSIPSLSSIDLNSHETGFQAARLLQRMMHQQSIPKRLPKIQPGEITVRRSTDVLATQDVEVIEAVKLIRERACFGLSLDDVLRHVALSRSAFAPRFKAVLGRTIHAQIRHEQIQKTKDLLTKTELPIKQISIQTGFKNAQYLTRVFHSACKETPAVYRQKRKTV